ncbi:MAG: selenium cofactor biosynthesis protein YqeC [Thermodesulfobacteriota bacterium]
MNDERKTKNDERKTDNKGPLSEALGLARREMVSLVGAGGKTTLMFRLANELVLDGSKVLTTTTTKIMEPSSEETPFLFVHTDEIKVIESVSQLLHKYKHMTVASERIGFGKLKGISLNCVKALWDLKEVDYLIIEADGAAGRPIKAPREIEPVIPLATTTVIGLIGVDGLGKELNEENVFQPERVSRLTRLAMGEKLTEDAMARLMTDPEGVFKGSPGSSRGIVFLNKVDIEDGLRKAQRISEKIIERKSLQIERIILGQVKKEPPVVEVITLGRN